MSLCVREREREGEGKGGKEGGRERESAGLESKGILHPLLTSKSTTRHVCGIQTYAGRQKHLNLHEMIFFKTRQNTMREKEVA